MYVVYDKINLMKVNKMTLVMKIIAYLCDAAIFLLFLQIIVVKINRKYSNCAVITM